jgi:hypothetical protein
MNLIRGLAWISAVIISPNPMLELLAPNVFSAVWHCGRARFRDLVHAHVRLVPQQHDHARLGWQRGQCIQHHDPQLSRLRRGPRHRLHQPPGRAGMITAAVA